MTLPPRQFIIEGVDRMGKSTLIQGLLNELGYHLVVHYDKPKKLKAYEDVYVTVPNTVSPLWLYQVKLYQNMFSMIDAGLPLIFDRGHLGEVVYAPLYRKYAGDYVFAMERGVHTGDTRLILLMTSDFSFIEDDGLSHDFSKKEEEQSKFLAAFELSTIADKIVIDVSNGRGGYKTPEQILSEALRK
jgi:thymidylate kinase